MDITLEINHPFFNGGFLVCDVNLILNITKFVFKGNRSSVSFF